MLVHQGLEVASEEEDPIGASSLMSSEKRKHIINRARSTLILSLNDLF